MRVSSCLISALIACSVGFPALAANPTLDLTPYLIGQAPAGFGMNKPATSDATATTPTARAESAPVEKAAALNGTLYAVVAPTYQGNQQSYIRLFNGGSTTTTFSVTIVGSPTGKNYGTANYQVPTNASPQYALPDIIAKAAAGALTGGDTEYALYIQSASALAGYQHVIYNSANNFFENASICKNLLNEAITAVSTSLVLINVHSTALAAFPATFSLHNFWNASETYKVTLIDSATGSVLGQINMVAAPNATYEVPVATLQSQIGFTPTSAQTQLNIIVTDASGAPPYDEIGAAIVNANLQNAQINMSTACSVNTPTSSSNSIPTGLNGY